MRSKIRPVFFFDSGGSLVIAFRDDSGVRWSSVDRSFCTRESVSGVINEAVENESWAIL